MEIQIKNSKKRIWKKIIIILISFILLFIGTGFMYEAIASYAGVKSYPPEGELVNVGDFRLHLHKQGDGKPTIILEAGSGASSTSWGDVPEALSKYATVVTYDRGGYGWSEKAVSERTGENIVRELYSALKEAGIDGPYILVGHSLGGMYSRLFAQTYRNEVAGVILLDARPENFTKETAAIFEEAGIDPLYGGVMPKELLTLLKVTGIIRIMGQLDLLDIPKENLWKTINIDLRLKSFQTIFEELQYMKKLEKAIQDQTLGNIPLTIVTHGIPIDSTLVGLTKDKSDKVEDIWQAQQKQLLKLSTNSELIVAENSGHAIMVDEPMLLIEVITNMIEKVKE